MERKHRHLLNTSCALRFQANLPYVFWGECILTAAYLINRLSTQVLGGKTPHEILFQKKTYFITFKSFWLLMFWSKSHRQT